MKEEIENKFDPLLSNKSIDSQTAIDDEQNSAMIFLAHIQLAS
jgi:hypothetical protein